jgi:hypothetical protein
VTDGDHVSLPQKIPQKGSRGSSAGGGMLYKRRPEKQFHFFKTAPLKLQNTRIIPKNSRGQQLLEICTRVGKRNRCLSEYEKIRRYGFRKTSPEEGIQHLCPLKPKPPKIRRQRPTTLSVSSSAQHTLCQKKKKSSDLRYFTRGPQPLLLHHVDLARPTRRSRHEFRIWARPCTY